MDLLTGYGSDDSSSSSSSSSSSVQKGPVQQQPTTKPPPPVSTSESAPAATSSLKKFKRNDQNATGKRILKLNAVLPPDILERLTRSTVQSGGARTARIASDGYGRGNDDSDDSDSDSDNDDSGNEAMASKRNRYRRNNSNSKSNTTEKHTNIGNDLGLNSLLSDLQTVAPSAAASKNKNAKNKKNGIQKQNENNTVQVKDNEKNEKLGFAFMNVVSNTTTRKKRGKNDDNDDQNAVLDIHSTSATATDHPRKKAKAAVEEVDSDSDDEQIEDANAVPLFPSAQNQQPMKYTNNNAIRRPNITSNEVETASSSSSIKRPVIPSIPSNFQTIRIQPQQSHHQQLHQQPNPNIQVQTQHYQHHETPISNTTTNTKKSKRELEKALRMGNFDAIHTSNIQISQSIDTNNHIQPSEQELLATAATSHQAVSFYNTSNLQSYVPSEGTTAVMKDVSSTQKSKHQIHSLVENARKLEADMARMNAMGRGRGKSTRANAKKKYGW